MGNSFTAVKNRVRETEGSVPRSVPRRALSSSHLLSILTKMEALRQTALTANSELLEHMKTALIAEEYMRRPCPVLVLASGSCSTRPGAAGRLYSTVSRRRSVFSNGNQSGRHMHVHASSQDESYGSFPDALMSEKFQSSYAVETLVVCINVQSVRGIGGPYGVCM
eukprot:Gb_09944 [translate_table: standard]